MNEARRFRIEYRDAANVRGVGHVEVEPGPMAQLRAEAAFLHAAEAEGRKLWCTRSCAEPQRAGETS